MNRNVQTQRIFDGIIPLLLLIITALLTYGLLNETQATLVEDWLSQEGGLVFRWWLLATLAGAAVFPLLYRLMPSLSSRGYALARAAGLMLTGFIFWFLASLGFLTNSTGSMIFAWLVVVGLSMLAWTRRRDPQNIREWFKENWSLVLVVEILFIAMLFILAAYRAHEPEIRTTEKPMEMMFINSIRQSETFPPNDAWMAGYSISYYYFGYVITAALADLSGVNTGIAFGLIGPLLFALSGIGILGIVYDLVRARPLSTWRGGSQAAGLMTGLLAVFFLVIMGNLGTFFIELPWNGYAPSIASMEYFEFWDVPERSELIIQQTNEGGTATWVDSDGNPVSLDPARPPEEQGYVTVRDSNQNGEPDFSEEAIEPRKFTNWGYWWWFRYSRVVKDRFLDRTVTDPVTDQETIIEGREIGIQPIDEFPHFSLVLSDIHPHVLALPFAVLAIGLTVGLALREHDLEWWGYILLAIWVGGMVFMNSWDAVFLPFLFAGEALRRLIRNHGRMTANEWGHVAIFALSISALTIGLYFPWILSFTSQASGFYPNIIWPTLPQQLFLQFGAFFLVLIPFLIREFLIGRNRINWRAAIGTFLVLFLLIVVALPFLSATVTMAACDELAQPRTKACEVRDILLGGVTPNNNETFWQDLLERRAKSYLSEGLILLAIVLIGFRLFAHPIRKPHLEDDEETIIEDSPPYTRPHAVTLLMIAAGLVLIFAPDFVYLVDNFSVRINTVFKLYYQGWIFFSVAGAYAVYAIFADAGNPLPVATGRGRGGVSSLALQGVFGALLVLVLWMGAIYPLYASRTRALQESGRYTAYTAYEACIEAAENLEADDEIERQKNACQENLPALTLDGRPKVVSEDEFKVVQCLMALNPGPDTIIAEAPFEGGYQPDYGRIAMLTGIPNLLGWQNHERQWRGDTYESVAGDRSAQLDRLYQSDSLEFAQNVIDRYGIDYVVVGQAEYTRYSDYIDGLEKFADYFNPVCQSGNVALYQVN